MSGRIPYIMMQCASVGKVLILHDVYMMSVNLGRSTFSKRRDHVQKTQLLQSGRLIVFPKPIRLLPSHIVNHIPTDQ